MKIKYLFLIFKDFGGSPTLFGIASVINHLSEVVAYFYSVKIIGKIGHIKLIAFGMLCNVARFLYISFITMPWFILPFEFVQGENKSHFQGLLVSYVQRDIFTLYHQV